MLSVVIPTYNRNARLLATLEQLLPQLEREAARCQLLILDNASPTPVIETVGELLARFPGVKSEVQRNRANIGANANILRCFEECQTPYLWTLSDDDDLKPDAVQTILSHIEAHPECVFFNFGVEHSAPREKTYFSRGQLDFVRRMDSFGNTIFISTNVYRNDAVLDSLKFAHHYTYTAVPQFVMVFKSLQADSVCCFSHQPIVTLGLVPPEHQWSRVLLALGVRTLLELPMDAPVRKALAPHLTRFDHEFMKTRHLVHQLLQTAVATRDWRGALYLFDQMRHRRHNAAFYCDSSRRARIEASVLRYLLFRPRLGLRLISWHYKIKKIAVENGEVPSFSERL